MLKHINYIIVVTLLFVTLIYATTCYYYGNYKPFPVVYASPGHTFDTKARGTGSTNPTTLSYTCGSGTTVLVLGIVVAGFTARAGGSPSYNSVTMTKAGTTRIATETNCELWYLLAPSTGSAYTISVPNTGLRTLYLIASSYKAQAGCTSVLDVTNGATGTSVSTSCAVTTTANGDVIVDVAGTGSNNVPTAHSHTLLYSTDDGLYSDNAQYTLQTSAGLATFTWTQGASDDWCQVVVAFKESNLAPSNDQLTLDLTGASYKNTKTLLCAKQDYKFVYKCTDNNGVTDVTYAQIQLDPTGKNVILRATRGSGDAWTFSENSDPTNYVTLNVAGSSDSTSGNQKTFNFLVTINWNWGDSGETVTVRCYVIDASSASDQDDYTDIFGVECHLTSASLVVSDYRCNPSQTSLTFSGYWYYDGTSIVPPDGNYAVVIKLSGAQKGSTDTTLVLGAFSINDVTAESTVNSYSYTVEVTYMSGAGSFSAVIVDRIKVLSYTVSDSRANINDSVNIDATLRYEYDNTAITTGIITINGYSASHIGSGVYRITRTSASVTSVTYNTVAGSESTYGLNTVNQNGQSTTVIWDRLQVQSYTTSDSRANINDNVNIDALVWFDYDNTVCTTATITINGFSAVHQGIGVYRITRTSATVTSITCNTVACSAESTYGITTVDQNSQSTTVIWDEARVYYEVLDDSRVDVNANIEFRVKGLLLFDNHALGSGDTVTANFGTLTWDSVNGYFKGTRSQASVGNYTFTVSSLSEATYGITVFEINVTNPTGVWDRIEVYEADEPLTIGSSNLNSNFDKQINIIVFMILSTLILVSLVSVKKTKKRLLITLIMFFAIVSMMPINLTFATENKGEHPINSVVRIWYKARYDYDDVVFDNSKGTLYINGTLATWNGTGGYWYRDVTSAQIGVKTYLVDQVSDTEYGLTVIVHTCSYITITWVEVTGYNLNLRVMDWDITDSIANAYVCMNNGTENWKTSDINGWANYTLVSGSVTVEVRYFGFWVNETSLTISSDTTMSLQCKLYDVIVNVRENVRNAKLSNVNVTVYNSTNYKIKSGISGSNGQVSLSNLPNNTLTFTQYGGNSYTLVIGNTTEPIGSDDYVFTVICNQNYVGTTSNYSILVWVGGIVIPLEGSFVTKRLKRKMYKKRKKPK